MKYLILIACSLLVLISAHARTYTNTADEGRDGDTTSKVSTYKGKPINNSKATEMEGSPKYSYPDMLWMKKSKATVNVSPNTSRGAFNVEEGYEKLEMELFNEEGKRVNFFLQGSQLELIDKIPGNYILAVLQKDGTLAKSNHLVVN